MPIWHSNISFFRFCSILKRWNFAGNASKILGNPIWSDDHYPLLSPGVRSRITFVLPYRTWSFSRSIRNGLSFTIILVLPGNTKISKWVKLTGQMVNFCCPYPLPWRLLLLLMTTHLPKLHQIIKHSQLAEFDLYELEWRHRVPGYERTWTSTRYHFLL